MILRFKVQVRISLTKMVLKKNVALHNNRNKTVISITDMLKKNKHLNGTSTLYCKNQFNRCFLSQHSIFILLIDDTWAILWNEFCARCDGTHSFVLFCFFKNTFVSLNHRISPPEIVLIVSKLIFSKPNMSHYTIFAQQWFLPLSSCINDFFALLLSPEHWV